MNFVNLTPHAIVVRRQDGSDLTIAPSGQVARVAETPGQPISLGPDGAGVSIWTSPVAGEVQGLPDPTADTVYIVSAVVAAALAGRGRSDVLRPGTGPQDCAVRSADGKIVAVTRLIRV
jgi:hypothetical protein